MLLHRLEYIIWLFLVVWRRFSWQWPHERAAFFFSCLCSQLNTLTSSFGRVFYASQFRKQDQRTKKQQTIWNKSLHKTKLDVCATSHNGYTESSYHSTLKPLRTEWDESNPGNHECLWWSQYFWCKMRESASKELVKSHPQRGYQRSLWSERVWHVCWHACYMLSHFSQVLLCDPMACGLPDSLSMGFSRQEYQTVLPCPPPGDLPDPGVEPGSPTLQADSLLSEPPGKPEAWSLSLSVKESFSHLLEKEMAIHSSILTWKIPWTEEPGRSMGSRSQTWLSMHTYHIPEVLASAMEGKINKTYKDWIKKSKTIFIHK